MTLIEYIAIGAGASMGFKLTSIVWNSTEAFILGMCHGWRPDIFACPHCTRVSPCYCGTCALDCCRLEYQPNDIRHYKDRRYPPENIDDDNVSTEHELTEHELRVMMTDYKNRKNRQSSLEDIDDDD